MTCPSLEAWLEAIDSGAPAPVGGHVDCDLCRGSEASARELISALRRGAPRSALSDEQFVQRVVAHRPRHGRSRGLVLVVAPLAAAAALLLALRPRAAPDESSAPIARGHEASPSATCEVALVKPEGLQFLHDGDHVPAAAKLAFRVRNPAQQARWLGVFGVSARGRVGWYHPAYETPRDDPQTLRMPAANEALLLQESVALALGEGPVRIVCWQANHPSRVREADGLVEAELSRGQGPSVWTRIESLGGDQASIILWFDSER